MLVAFVQICLWGPTRYELVNLPIKTAFLEEREANKAGRVRGEGLAGSAERVSSDGSQPALDSSVRESLARMACAAPWLEPQALPISYVWMYQQCLLHMCSLNVQKSNF